MKSRADLLVRVGLGVVLLPPLVIWFRQWIGDFDQVGLLEIFPLLGLLAFSIMWYHFAVASLKRLRPKLINYDLFFRRTGNIVLALIILHPLLLWLAGWQHDFTPLDYVGAGARIYLYFAMIALGIFLIYEVIDRSRDHPLVKKHWQTVATVNRIGFILIYLHGLNVGQHLQSGWLRSLWLFYGVSSLLFFAQAYWEIYIKKAK